jgi:hypothetical protein
VLMKRLGYTFFPPCFLDLKNIFYVKGQT